MLHVLSSTKVVGVYAILNFFGSSDKGGRSFVHHYDLHLLSAVEMYKVTCVNEILLSACFMVVYDTLVPLIAHVNRNETCYLLSDLTEWGGGALRR